MNARLHVRQILCLVLCLLPLVLLGILVDAGFGELVTGVGMLAGAGVGELVGAFLGDLVGEGVGDLVGVGVDELLGVETGELVATCLRELVGLGVPVIVLLPEFLRGRPRVLDFLRYILPLFFVTGLVVRVGDSLVGTGVDGLVVVGIGKLIRKGWSLRCGRRWRRRASRHGSRRAGRAHPASGCAPAP